MFGLLVSAATGDRDQRDLLESLGAGDRDERDLLESLGGFVEGRNLI